MAYGGEQGLAPGNRERWRASHDIGGSGETLGTQPQHYFSFLWTSMGCMYGEVPSLGNVDIE
jgi:hypothetical protein